MMNITTLVPGDRDVRTVTVGLFRSSSKGEILLIYLNDGADDAAVMRYDQLSRKNRSYIHAAARDPLSVLKRTKKGMQAARRAV